MRGADQAASRLLKRDDIQSRISELQAEAASRAEISVDTLVQDFQNIHDKAMLDPKTYMAATNAKIAQAKICGLWNEKITVAAESMTDEELVKALKDSGSVVNFGAALKASRGR